MTTYKNSKDLSGCIMDFEQPITKIEKERMSLIDIRKSDNMYAIEIPKSGESEEDKFIRESNNADKRMMLQTIYTQHIKSISDRLQQCEQNLTILWNDIIGQCSPALQEELHGAPDYTSKSSVYDAVWLLQTLQRLTAGANKTTNKYFSVFGAAKSFFNTVQHNNEPLDEFYTRFESAKDLVELFDAKIIDLSSILAFEQKSNPSLTMRDIEQKFFAMSLVLNANKKRYEGLWIKLQNDLLMGQDSYPTTIGAATHLLANWKSDSTPSNRDRGNDRDGNSNGQPHAPNIQFAQIPIPADNDFSRLPGYNSARPHMVPSRKPPHNITPHITCSRCNKPGHYASACPFLLTGTPQLFQCAPTIGYQFTATTQPAVFEPGCIIVDSGSSFNSVRDLFVLSSVQPCPPFDSITNGGGIQYVRKGPMTLFPSLQAYYDPNCLANIVSLDLLQLQYHVVFDSSIANTFVVHLDDNSQILFKVVETDFTCIK